MDFWEGYWFDLRLPAPSWKALSNPLFEDVPTTWNCLLVMMRGTFSIAIVSLDFLSACLFANGTIILGDIYDEIYWSSYLISENLLEPVSPNGLRIAGLSILSFNLTTDGLNARFFL
jgi:hypothetical protein